MSTIPERIHELMALMLDGEQTTAEEREFGDWLSQNSAHEAVWHDYQKLHRELESLKMSFHTDVEFSLHRVKRIRRHLIFRRWVGWAAIFVLPLVIGLWLWLSGSFQEDIHRQFGQIASPGTDKAILQMANGRKVMLGAGSDSVILVGNGTVIRNDSGKMLSYRIDSNSLTNEVKMNKLIVPRGGEYRLTLCDGTRVWLNSSTVLSFPQVFTGDTRRVHLSGEAYFEVTPDASHPFIVSVSDLEVKVLGTSFDVADYGDEEVVRTTLVTGSVELYAAGYAPRMLVPGEQGRLGKEGWEIEKVDVEQYTSWIDGRFVFRNTTLEEICRQISRWYDVDVFFSSEVIKKVRFTGVMLRFDPLENMIRMIETTSDVRFCVKGKTIVISEI